MKTNVMWHIRLLIIVEVWVLGNMLNNLFG